MTQRISLNSILCVSLWLALCLASAVFAQDSKNLLAPSVAAAASFEQARFLADNEVANIRLEVFTLDATRLYDSDFHAGNLLDWKWQDQQGQRLPDGTYRCLLTVKDLTGQSSQRQGILLMQNGEASWQAPEQAEAALRNKTAAERIAYFATVTNPTELAAVVSAHDGKDARLMTGSGALSFTSGNFLTGREQEQMRLTADGKLEVNGLIRTGAGVVFPDGTVQKTAYVVSGKDLGKLSDPKPGKSSPNALAVGGSGTPNILLKWAANGVDAMDSTVTDLGPGGGISVLGSVLSSFNNVSATGDFVGGFTAYWATGTSRAFLLRSASLSGNLWIGHLGNVGIGISDPGSRFATGGNATVGAAYYNTAAPLNGLIVEGNVGIGITNPGVKLDVVGTINASTQYNIGGNRILSNAGAFNLFAGINAGAANTGSFNSFFGALAGNANTTGGFNSFFGVSAGNANTTGSSNSFFGRRAGRLNTANANSFFGALAGDLNTTGSSNSFFGANAGESNTTGNANSFFGTSAGNTNTTGGSNSFVGYAAGESNTTGSENAFFGASAGDSNTTADYNAFFGSNAGATNTTGGLNAFFGAYAGNANTTGSENAFFGTSTGRANTTGFDNAFFGRDAGRLNTTGYWNAFFGIEAGRANTISYNNSFFGRRAGVSSTGINNSFFGASAGDTNTTGPNNAFFGTVAGSSNTTGNSNAFFGFGAGGGNTTGNYNTALGRGAGFTSNNLTYATAIGADATGYLDNAITLGRSGGEDEVLIPGHLSVRILGNATATPLCITNGLGIVSSCSSSQRYKESIVDFKPGLQLLNRLRPVTFAWKADHVRDLGLIAEEVAAIEPLLVTHNKTGVIEGVKYDQLAVVLINAVKEQQAQIASQQQQIVSLKKLVCRIHRKAKRRLAARRDAASFAPALAAERLRRSRY